MADSNAKCGEGPVKAPSAPSAPSVRIAVEGCGHGCLHDIYASVERAANLKGWDGVDLLIIGGDFQAVRNSNDMACMSVPDRFKQIGDFQEYYSGQRTAPYLTIFIGGNHEASNYLFELYYGGWVAPNIYYMGAANVLRYGPLRIAGFSGIWKPYDYDKPHHERLPYNVDDITNIYHVRELDIRKLLQIRTQVDIGLSHDWPRQVEYSGDWRQLFRSKPFLREDSEKRRLGSQAAEYVLKRLRPAYWFSAHLHVMFAAVVQHAPQNIHASHQFGLDGASLTNMFGDDEEETQQTGYGQVGSQLSVRPDSQLEGSEAQHESNPEIPLRPSNENIPVPTEFESSQGNTENTSRLVSAWNNFQHVAAKNEAADNSRFLAEHGRNQGQSTTLDVHNHNVTWKKIETDEDGLGRRKAGVERSGPRENKKQKVQHETQTPKNSDEIELDLDSDSDPDHEAAPLKSPSMTATAANVAPPPSQEFSKPRYSEVSDDVRNQLPPSFFKPQQSPQPPNLPFPCKIHNTTTNFLALSKCEPNRQFLQLLEVNPISEQSDAVGAKGPFQLHYDKEWLAITRVFAADLQLGGNPDDKIPVDKGEAVYRTLIEEEEKWVDEHIVQPGRLAVPANFTPTAPFYDPEVPITTDQQPHEYNNPQTAAFCELRARREWEMGLDLAIRTRKHGVLVVQLAGAGEAAVEEALDAAKVGEVAVATRPIIVLHALLY
ncbi:RNA lariat debranching enzyme [Aspergillus mulundensis]|uniref:Lariat debranching enzyme C-terminal domain-containing protein n=1 Tax=Aspergillus mulundensis TaxID=1810919 RepID=A0A3D8RYY4_9EURO|nr:hypothetical protein DSM5745_05893 [Aspergillus mulundensis]RDW79041.1 hypothetical protein DSM5745_05893 [Aspergillus mulundensis]